MPIYLIHNHSYEFKAVLHDNKTGNAGTQSNLIEIGIDTQPPSVLNESLIQLYDDFGNATGAINKGGITDDWTPIYRSLADQCRRAVMLSVSMFIIRQMMAQRRRLARPCQS